MTDTAHPGAALRPYSGAAARSIEFERRRLGPWDGTVRLVHLRLSAGERLLTVEAEWTGTLPGSVPLGPGIRPGRATDVVVVDDLAHAQAVMRAAEDDLRERRAPDLRVLAARLKQRV